MKYSLGTYHSNFKYVCIVEVYWWHVVILCLLAQISKATTLHKTAEYISKMQQERAQLHDEAQRLRDEIQLLNSAIKWDLKHTPRVSVCVLLHAYSHELEGYFR